MKRQPLVSIITPTYNHEKFIEQCIESVLIQTYPRWEQIIIANQSQLGSSQICRVVIASQKRKVAFKQQGKCEN